SPLLAKLTIPVGVAFEASGNTYIADYANNVIKEIVSSLLPTKLLSFQGHLTGNNETLLKWSTSLEERTAYFDVQYSADGKQFSSVSSVYAKGESSSYSYTHCCPAAGNNYYRLKMVDQDGKFSFSEIVSVKMEEGKSGVTIFPNPSSDVFVIRFPVSKKEDAIRIMNSNGTVLKFYDIPEGSSEKLISLKGMPAGIYLAQFTNSELGTAELILR
ncbi:MAG: T9SS type A sorting domain-containing protein, partial [Bacteroidota bacterium]|nr:T9SS type A sorting domain-containing protein [Bacteroidota bacterium]